MTSLIQYRRPNFTDLFWSGWPVDVMASLELPKSGTLAMRTEELIDGDTYVIKAELPGIDPEKDAEILVADDTLTIKAQRRETFEEGEPGKAGYRSEFRYGSYERSLPLPVGAIVDDVKATYADGILQVRLPLRHGVAEPHKIEVTKV
jgi:HSP20 family protein